MHSKEICNEYIGQDKVKITVIGLGFVGLPLLKVLHEAGHKVFGIDISNEKIDSFKSNPDLDGIEFFSEIQPSMDTDAYVLALPTPLDEQNNPDLSALISICDKLGDFIDTNQVVIVESTYSVGTTRNVILPKLGKKIGEKQVKLIYSPERINPGDSSWNLKNTPKLVAAEDEFSAMKITELYGEICDHLVFVESYEIAESAKLLENIYRYVNINFINEFQQNCDVLGLEASKVIAAASTKPFGFHAFSPSLGVGGHCIPIAPHHFIESLKNQKIINGFIEHGKKINDTHFLRVIDKIESKYEPLVDKKVLVVGVTYKPDVADVRESLAVTLITNLRNRGIKVSWFDPLVFTLNGEERSSLSTGADVALICVHQPDHVVLEILANSEIVLDISSGLDIRRLK